MKKMTKEYVQTTISEERLWKCGESDSFNYAGWNITLEKQESDLPFLKDDFLLTANKENGESFVRRYESLQLAFLHIVNNFNDSAEERVHDTIESYLSESEQVQEGLTIKQHLLKLGVLESELDYHASDLYVLKNHISEKWLNTYKFKEHVKTFRSKIDGQIWYDIPFGYFAEYHENKFLT